MADHKLPARGVRQRAVDARQAAGATGLRLRRFAVREGFAFPEAGAGKMPALQACGFAALLRGEASPSRQPEPARGPRYQPVPAARKLPALPIASATPIDNCQRA